MDGFVFMKIAVILGGLPRFNLDSLNSYKEKVISPLEKNHEISFYISTDEEYINSWQSVNFNHKTHLTITQDKNYIEGSIFNRLNIDPQDVANYYNQYRHIYSAFNLMLKDNIAFDWVLKNRLDFIYFEEFKENLSCVLGNTLIVPRKEWHCDWEFDPGILCTDQFWLADVPTMKKVCNMIYDHEFTFNEYLTYEGLLRQFLYFRQIDVKLFDHSFLFTKAEDLKNDILF